MPKIGKLIAAFETGGAALSADLATFLDLTWSHRKNTRTGTYDAKNADVYGLYARAGRGSAPSGAVVAFLKELLTFPRLPEIQCTPTDPLGGYLRQNFGGKQAPSGFMLVPRDGFIKLIGAAEKSENVRAYLGNTFYHFRRGSAHSAERIYLHVKPLHCTRVIRFIVEQMLLRPNVHPAMTNAKTGAPGRETRFDSLVLYFTSVAGVEKALDEIAAYQMTRNYRESFEHGTTRSTLQITNHKGVELVGVGTGAEPPVAAKVNNGKLVLLPQSTSFGTFRCTLISFALGNTLAAKEGKAEFVARVIKYFRAAGIDPRKPHEHGMAAELQHRAQVTLRQLQQGKEPTWEIK